MGQAAPSFSSATSPFSSTETQQTQNLEIHIFNHRIKDFEAA
jgi:hypothetical protein